MESNLIFKQFRSDGGCNSYLLGDLKKNTAVLIDPRMDEGRNYEEVLFRHQLKLVSVLETHTHADHFSGSHYFSRKWDLPIVMGSKTNSKRATRIVREKDTVEISSQMALSVLEVPGHTPDSLCFLLEAGQHKIIFTGDTLLVGGSGRTDFPGADANALFESLQKITDSLDSDFHIFPGHDYSDVLFSRMDLEAKNNSHLKIKNLEDFKKLKSIESLQTSYSTSFVIDFNLAKYPELTPRSGVLQACSTVCGSAFSTCSMPVKSEQRLTLEEFNQKKGSLLVDIREPEEFELGHLPYAINIPMGKLFLELPHLKNKDVIFYCQTGRRSQSVLRTLDLLGMKNISDLSGGYSAFLKLKLISA